MGSLWTFYMIPFYDFGHGLTWKKNELVENMSETGRPVRLALGDDARIRSPWPMWDLQTCRSVLARGMEPMRQGYLGE